MNVIAFETVTKVYRLDSYTISNCNTIAFINTGGIEVSVDSVLLQPGQSLVISGNFGEINVKQYSFEFGDPIVGAFPSLTVVRKIYVDKKFQEDVFKGTQAGKKFTI